MNSTHFKSIFLLLCLFFGTQRMNAQCNITLSAVVTDVSCFGGSNGAIDLTPAGGTPPYMVSWSNGAVDMEDIADLPGGQYIATVTDNVGCMANLARTVGQPDLLQVTVLGDTINCWEATITGLPLYRTDLTASVTGGASPYFYSWSNGGNGNIQSVNQAGTFTVTVIDGNNCVSSGEKLVVMDTIRPIADAGPNVNLSCQTDKVTIGGNNSTVAPNVSFLWSWPGQSFFSTEQFANATAPGTYTLEVFNEITGCSAQDVVVVGGTPPPLANAGPDAGIPCGGGQVTLDGSGSSTGLQYNHIWTTANGHILAGANTQSPIVNQPGLYTVHVIDIQNGCERTDDVKVFPGPAIPQSDFSVTDVSCTGQLGVAAVNMTQGSAPYTYLWSNGSTQAAIINVVMGTYTVTVTDASACNYYGEIAVKENATLSLSAQTTPPDCANGMNGAINLTATGGFGPVSYLWSTNANTQDITGLVAGTYTVTATYGLGTCSKTLSVQVQPVSFSLSTSVTDANTCLGTQGLIDLTVGGGAAPYIYIWSDGETAQDASPLGPGTYTVTVVDAVGCSSTASATINDASDMNLSTVVVHANCLGGTCSGSIDLSIVGGLPPYDYAWSPGITDQDIFNQCPGTYTVTVTDVNGCTKTISSVITTLSSDIVANCIPDDANCLANDGSIAVTVTGGFSPFYFFAWSDGGTVEDRSNLPAGTYTVTVTDQEGCSSTASTTVGSQGASFTLTVVTGNASCNGNDGTIDLTVNGGSGPFIYLWSDGNTVEDLTNLPAGIYTVTVTDAGGCTQTTEATINQNALFDISGTIVPSTTCGFSFNGAIDVTITPGGSYTYFWSNNTTTEDLSNLSPGSYTVTVSDGMACQLSKSFVVPDNAIFPQASTTTSNSTCDLSNGGINLTVNAGVAPYNYQWSNGATTQDLANILAGLYQVTVTGANTCTAIVPVTVTNINPMITLTGNVTPSTSCVQFNGSIDLTVAPPGSYTVLWANGATTQDLSNLTPGNYSVTVSAGGSCTETATYTVLDNSTTPVFDIVSLSNNCLSETLSGPNFPGAVYQWTGPNGFTANTVVINTDIPGLYTLAVTDATGCTGSDTYTVNLTGGNACGYIKGRVFHDEDESCTLNFGEPGLGGWIVRAEGAIDTLYGVTDATGRYLIGVPVGDFAVKVFVPNGLWSLCPGGTIVSVNMAGDTVSGGDFPVQAIYHCPALTVSIGTNKLRRCFSDNFYEVEYANNGTQDATNAYVTVVLDNYLTLVASSVPYTDMGANVIQVNLGTLSVGETGMFKLQVAVNCNAVLGQTHCTQASIYPDTLCAPVNANWSGASLQVQSICNNDSLRFVIQNAGKGDMNSTREYIVVEDGIMFRSGTLAPLAENETMEIAVPANGSTWRVEVEQEAFHPFPNVVGLSIEGCTANSSFSTGFVNQFPLPDESPALDIDCTANIGSFDPNDKYGYPVGYGADHYVRPGTDIEYLIRFQNTGTDTAFTVHIVDTLSSWLDPSSIRFGAGSHPYRYDLNGKGVVHFIFDNIQLPDSSTNEAASHGFAKFIIKPRSDAPLETVIENTAAIYFDFNDPVFTNTTTHRLGHNFVKVGVWQPFVPEAQVSVVPNPFGEETTLEVKGLRRKDLLWLHVFDLQGNLVRQMESTEEMFRLKRADMPPGIYLFKVTQGGRLVGNGKLVAE